MAHYSAILKLFTTKDEEFGNFICCKLQLALKKRTTLKNVRIKSILKSDTSTMVDGNTGISDELSHKKDIYHRCPRTRWWWRIWQTGLSECINLLYMYCKNKLVDFLSSQNVTPMNIRDMSSLTEKKMESQKEAVNSEELSAEEFEEWNMIYFVVFRPLRFRRGTKELYSSVRSSVYQMYTCYL